MKKEHKNLLENRHLTEDLLLSCLTTCENIIRKNAYLEKQWNTHAVSLTYEAERLEWSDYRAKIRKALQRRYEMKKIIALTKTHTDKVPKTTVKAVVEQIDTGDFVLL